MPDVIEIGVVGEAVAEIDADALPDLASALMPRLKLLLNDFEAVGVREACWNLDARPGSQSEDALLGEIGSAATAVTRPFIDRRIGTVIDRGEGQLVQP